MGHQLLDRKRSTLHHPCKARNVADGQAEADVRALEHALFRRERAIFASGFDRPAATVVLGDAIDAFQRRIRTRQLDSQLDVALGSALHLLHRTSIARVDGMIRDQVPRLWTLFQQRIQDKLPQKKLNILLKIPFVNSLIKKKLAEGLGLDQARVLGCGSAPVSPALLEWYHSVGLNITEAWGMTESFAYSTLNYPFRADKIGSVGNAGPGIELKIADDDEIMVRGKGLFSGYYKNDIATQESFDSEGWLHTGDIGSIDSDGYLTIQGRKKDNFKTAKGKFVSPVPIEKKLFEYSRVEMMCLIGLGLPAPILLVVPHDFPNFDRERYARTTRKVIAKMNQELASHEQIKGVLMIKEPWSIENGVLTPTLKIKRHVLEQKYHEIGHNWPKGELVVWEEDL